LISAYLEALASALSFDRSLSQCVRREVEDHLREAVAADPEGDGPEAERRAVAKFGDPRLIAAQFAAVSLARQTRNVGAAVILVIAGVFVAMKARLAWYAVAQCVLRDEMRAVSELVVSVDRYAFWLSIAVGITCWAYISSRRTPATFHSSYRRELHRFFLLCVIATGALITSVASDGVLTALRLFEAESPFEFLIPIFSMAIEVAGAAVLVAHIRTVTRRTASTAALLGTRAGLSL
jgi:hypothetical protein